MYIQESENDMGDIKRSTASKIKEREERKKETVHVENETINKISDKGIGKDKAISARVNSTTYQNFKEISKARGLTANAALNMLITDFVRENKKILEEK